MIINQEKWNKCVTTNLGEPYGKCCVDIALKCMQMLDEIDDFIPDELITEAEKAIGESGITGFMAGCIASMISEYHSRGKEFREKWNALYNVKSDEFVVNPAIITIETK